ncbi:MAG: fasciclin domain-containing protein [Methyloceanibacter sp.]|uniref:fasciclin domain-containing protein n=1 Tax=Methyloceanibacter sp. TaxID=1965321 RepID=UPI003C3B6E7A
MMWKTIAGATALSLMVVGTAHASQAPNLYERANADGSFKAFVTEVNAAGLSDALKGAGEWTIFAPTDEAFAALPNGTVERLLEPENKDELVILLKNNIIPGKSFVSQWANGKVATQTKTGNAIEIDGATANQFTVDDAQIVRKNIPAANGMIHALDGVLVPPES